MITAAPVTYILSGLFQDMRGDLHEVCVKTRKPDKLLWDLYRRLVQEVHLHLGGGMAIPVGVFISSDEYYVVCERYTDPDWPHALWPTEIRYPIMHPWNVAGPDTTINMGPGVSLLNIIPHARVPPHRGVPESVHVSMWLCNGSYAYIPPAPIDTPDTLMTRVLITCGDRKATLAIDFPIEATWNYRDFISALVQHTRTVSSMWCNVMYPYTDRSSFGSESFGLFLLPPNTPEDEYFLSLIVLLSMHTQDSVFGPVASVLPRLLWGGPLWRSPWSEITGCMHNFKLLVVTGFKRAMLWYISMDHVEAVMSITEGWKTPEVCKFGADILFHLLTHLDWGISPVWEPDTIFMSKIYHIDTLQADTPGIDGFMDKVGRILDNRTAVIKRRRYFLVVVSILVDGRLVSDVSDPIPRGLLFHDMYNQILDTHPVLGDGMAFAGMFLAGTQYDELDLLLNHTTPPREPLFLSDASQRIYEAHHFLPYDNDEPPLRPLADMRTDTRCMRILFRPTLSPFPWPTPYRNQHYDLVVHVLDGTMCSRPQVVFSVDQEWDYATFLTELLLYLIPGHARYKALFDTLVSSGHVGRGALRLFVVPPQFKPSLRFACSLLCDSGRFGDDNIACAIPEITWDGNARAFSLGTVIPPECEVVVLVKHSLRRGWAQIGEVDIEQLSVARGQYFINELYRDIMAWYAQAYTKNPQMFVHVHIMTYYEDVNYDTTPDHEAVLEGRLVESSRAVLELAVPEDRELMLGLSQEWGGYISI
jgi:hypothetical protein